MVVNKILLMFAILFSIVLVSASINDTKFTICNSINLTEPNCTTWWTTLNLTESNFTVDITINYHMNNYTNITITNITYNNYTGNYTIYNITKIITNEKYIYNSSHNKSYIDKKISDLDIGKYAIKSELDYVTTASLSDEINKTIEATTIKTKLSVGLYIAIWCIALAVVGLIGWLIYLRRIE